MAKNCVLNKIGGLLTGEKIHGEISLQLSESDVAKIIKPIGHRYKFVLNRDKQFVTFTKM